MKGNAKAATPEEYIEQLAEPRRSELAGLHKLIRATVPRLAPTMAFGMIGYGPFHYKYKSGLVRGTGWWWRWQARKTTFRYISVPGMTQANGISPRSTRTSSESECGQELYPFHKKLEHLDRDVLKKALKEAQKNARSWRRWWHYRRSRPGALVSLVRPRKSSLISGIPRIFPACGGGRSARGYFLLPPVMKFGNSRNNAPPSGCRRRNCRG